MTLAVRYNSGMIQNILLLLLYIPSGLAVAMRGCSGTG